MTGKMCPTLGGEQGAGGSGGRSGGLSKRQACESAKYPHATQGFLPVFPQLALPVARAAIGRKCSKRRRPAPGDGAGPEFGRVNAQGDVALRIQIYCGLVNGWASRSCHEGLPRLEGARRRRTSPKQLRICMAGRTTSAHLHPPSPFPRRGPSRLQRRFRRPAASHGR